MTKQSKNFKNTQTSWEDSAKWYDVAVGEKGHYYHENVILPNLLEILNLKGGDRLLDLACGQGILERNIPQDTTYLGVDLSPSLISSAKSRCKNNSHRFLCADVTKPLTIEKDFSHASIVLALQNIEDPSAVIKNASLHLRQNGLLCIVINHPCFRIPRLSHWGIDEGKQLQYRRLDSYLSSQKIPIQTHPGRGKGEQTWTFHHPLSSFTKWLNQAGFAIMGVEEWVSDKSSTGKKARMENRSRKEFPLFLTLVCRKLN